MNTFPFLRTYKPLLKRARGTPFYDGIRSLLQVWLFHKRIVRLLDAQNAKLYLAARERDRLLAFEKASTAPDRGMLLNRRAWLGSQIVALPEQIERAASMARSIHNGAEEARQALPRLKKQLQSYRAEYGELEDTLRRMGAYG